MLKTWEWGENIYRIYPKDSNDLIMVEFEIIQQRCLFNTAFLFINKFHNNA